MMQIDIRKAKTQLPKLIKCVQSGMTVSITSQGNPVAQLVAVTTKQPYSDKHDFLGWLERNPLPAHARRSGQEIDADIEETFQRNAAF
jgi:antitoxin (DNA-binding transcriptional repressor) of toxin-antitoxin stability system